MIVKIDPTESTFCMKQECDLFSEDCETFTTLDVAPLTLPFVLAYHSVKLSSSLDTAGNE